MVNMNKPLEPGLGFKVNYNMIIMVSDCAANVRYYLSLYVRELAQDGRAQWSSGLYNRAFSESSQRVNLI